MFSYSWKNKHNVRHIYDIINNEFDNVPKWIDTEKMSGNIHEAMHNAIETSFLVIIFMSVDYKKSKNCKIESELIIGKQKDYILVLFDNNFPFLENKEKTNWINCMYKNQFYIDLSMGMKQEQINKLLILIKNKINKYYGIPTSIPRRRPSFTRNTNNVNISVNKNSPQNKRMSPVKKDLTFTLNSSLKKNEIDNFILNNNLEQTDVDNIKYLINKTPRTMIPTLKAGGLSFKGILEIINDIKDEE